MGRDQIDHLIQWCPTFDLIQSNKYLANIYYVPGTSVQNFFFNVKKCHSLPHDSNS